jgi:hypothetical protein
VVKQEKSCAMIDFQPIERKVHLFHDQQGATYQSMGKERLYADTLCKMNSRDPQIQLTTDPALVTCKTCLRKMGRSAAPVKEIIRVVRVLEYVGERSAVERVLQQNAVKGFADFGPVTIREAMLPFPEVLSDGR